MPVHLFLGNLHARVTPEELRRLFLSSGFTTLNSFSVSPRGKVGSCMAPTRTVADTVIAAMDRKVTLYGNLLRVAYFASRTPTGTASSSTTRITRPATTTSTSTPTTSSPLAPPPMVPIKENMLFVGNLPIEATETDLTNIFDGYNLKSATIVLKPDGTSRGFGFAEFSNKGELENALTAVEGTQVEGKVITLKIAQEQPRRNPRRIFDNRRGPRTTDRNREVSKTVLYVNKIHYDANEKQLTEVFGKYNPTKIVLSRNPQTNRSRGFGFVFFDDEAAALAALEANRTELFGLSMNVMMSFIDAIPTEKEAAAEEQTEKKE